MSIEQNKAAVRQHIEAFKGNVGLLDDVWAPDGSVPTMRSLDQQKELVRWCHRVAPGFTITILDMVAEGDKVALWTRLDFTFRGPLDPQDGPWPDLGKPVSWQNMGIFHVVDGKILSESSVYGMTDMLVREGVYVPSRTEAVSVKV